MDEDPEVLAAIEASKQDYLAEDLEDPLIKAALAESLAEVEEVKTIEDSRDEKDSENNAENTDTEEKTSAGEEEIINNKISQEESDKNLADSVSEAVSVSLGNKTPEPSSPSTSLKEGEDGAESKTNGHSSDGEKK